MTQRRPTPLSSSTRVLSVMGAVWLGACASTDLEAPLSHPGHPQARAGQVGQTQALSAAQALESLATSGAAGRADEHAHHHPGAGAAHDHADKAPASAAHDHADKAPASAAHDHADKAPASAAHGHADKAPASAGKGKPAAAAVFTCPMHPEILRKEAGSCPICGMKLVPKKGAK